MSDILLYYQKVAPTTWAYLSSLLAIALYFKFSRLWSVRNLDLVGLILLTPGLLLVIYGQNMNEPVKSQAGYIWLFSIGGLFLIRMLLDPIMVRRPLLEPNLSVGGLTFLGLSLVVFLLANVLIDDHPGAHVPEMAPLPVAVEPGEKPGEPNVVEPNPSPPEEPLFVYGPGYPWVFEIFQLPTRLLFEGGKSPAAVAEHDTTTQNALKRATSRTVAIFSYLAILVGFIFIGYRHFDNIKTGIAVAVIYLLLPYTAILTGQYMAIHIASDSPASIDQVYHVLLAALLVWAIAMYRRPLISGILLGLAIGMFYYPVFLLPLWCSFYWQRGVLRFSAGVVAMIALLVGILYFHPYPPSFAADIRQMFGWILPRIESKHIQGFWGLLNDKGELYNVPVYRIPVLAAFIGMCITLTVWPAQKNLGTLLSCSAAVMLGIQFWHALGGGQLVAWYLPLMLLTIFRPNLEDRVALSVLSDWSLTKRKPRLAQIDQAA
jgi:hypothetical protein